jgi:hypothetical protein
MRMRPLYTAFLILSTVLLSTAGYAQSSSPPESGALSDEAICMSKFTLAVNESLAQRPIADVMMAVGTSFLGTPYLAYALEQPGEEHLVINLRGLDCVSFVENTLTLSRCIKLHRMTFEEFKKQLQRIRYRNGIIDKYPSRLHYFSDWIADNVKKGVALDMEKELDGIPFTKETNFMSTHRSSYRQLADEAFLQEIKNQETALQNTRRFYVPKEKLAAVQDRIHNGDIIGITTSVDGLDIAHTGLAIWRDGELRFLHAPLSKGKVQISEQPLVEYLRGYKNQTGIMVARPLEPVQ